MTIARNSRLVDNLKMRTWIDASLGGYAYADLIKSLYSTSLIGYWPLWELSGTVAEDISGNHRDGVYHGVDLGQPGIGDGRTAPYFDGLYDYVDIYSTSLRGAFNGSEGSAMAWMKVSSSAVWTDAAMRYVLYLYVDGNNYIRLYKSTTNNVLDARYRSGGTLLERKPTGITSTNWIHFCITWSKSHDRMRTYVNGSKFSTDVTGLGTWSGLLSSSGTLIGASAPNTSVWSGNIAHTLILNREATAAELVATQGTLDTIDTFYAAP